MSDRNDWATWPAVILPPADTDAGRAQERQVADAIGDVTGFDDHDAARAALNALRGEQP